MIFGIDPPSFDAVSGGLRYKKGKVFSTSDEIVIDDIFAKDKKLDVGDTYELEHRTFKVTGIVENGKGARVVMALKTAQELANAGNKVTVFLIKPKDASDIDGTIEKLKMDLPGYDSQYAGIRQADEWNQYSRPGCCQHAHCFRCLMHWRSSIFLSIHDGANPRNRILRSLGASKLFIVTLIMKEAMFICLIECCWVWQFRHFAYRHVVFSHVILISKVGARFRFAAGGVIGSLHPALRLQQDPVEAFAYE
jgi:putative ABC transport system permease protein